MSVCPHGTIRLPLEGFSWNRISEYFSKKNSGFINTWYGKWVFYMKTNRHFSSYLAQLFLEWEMFQIKVVEKTKTQTLCSITFFLNHAVYEITWQNTVQPGRPQMTIWRMCIACWVPKATNTHSEYVILIAFPLQQWFHERASVLRNTYTAYLVKFSVG